MRYSAALLVVPLLALFLGTTGVEGFSPAIGSAEGGDGEGGDGALGGAATEVVASGDTDDIDTFAKAFQTIGPSVVGLLAVRSNGSKRWASMGSGFIISKDGLVLTSEHNVDTGIRGQHTDRVYAVLSDHRVYRAKVLGRDAVVDAAVLQLLVDARTDDMLGDIFRLFASYRDEDIPEQIQWDAPLPVAELGNSTSLGVGSQVLAIGWQDERGLEAQAGIVTSFALASHRGGSRHILTDASIYKGYSGGPLIDMATHTVVGVHSHSVVSVFSNPGKKEPISEERNHALAIDVVQEVLPQMIGGETISHATIGEIRFLGLTRDLTQHSLSSGAEIVSIESNCRGSRAGLRKKDVIVEIGGEEVKNARDAERLIDQAPVGEKIEIVLMRSDQTRKVVKVKPFARSNKTTNGEAKIPLLRFFDWFLSRF